MDRTTTPDSAESVASVKLGWTAEEENARLAAIVNSSPDAIVSFAAEDGRIMTWNPAATRLFGYTEAEAVGAPVNLLLPWPPPEGPTGVFARAMAGEQVQIESVRRHKNGTLLDVAITATRIFGADGRVLGVSTMFRDITEQRRMALVMQAVMEHIPEGLTITEGPDVRIRSVSARGLQMVGRPTDMLMGTSAEEHPDVWQVYAADTSRLLAWDELPLTRATRNGEVIDDFVCQVKRADGTFLPILCNAAPIRDADGRVTGAIATWRDITESLAAQEALRIASERIELALNSGAVLGTWVWDIPNDRMTADERFARTFGLDPEVLRAGMPRAAVTQAIHPDDWPEVAARSEEAMRRGGAYRAEYRVREAGGSYRWIEANGKYDLDGAGRPLRFPGILIDIAERKRVEERLRDSEAEAREANRLLHAIIEAVPVLVYVKDRDGRMLIASQPVGDLFGRPLDQVIGHTDAELLSDREQAAIIMANDRRIMVEGGSDRVEEVAGFADDGPRIWLSHKTAFRNAGGEVVGLIGTSVDITDRKRAEQALAASEAQLRRVLDNLLVFVAVLDPKGTLVEISRSPLEAAGLTREQVLGVPFWDAHWHSYDPAIREKVRASVRRAAAGETVRFDMIVRTVGNDRLPIDYQIAPLRDESGKIVRLLPSAVSIADRKETEARLQEAMEQYREMGEAVPYGVWLTGPGGDARYFSPSFLELLNCSFAEARGFGWIDRVVPEDVVATRERWLACVASGEPWEAVHRIVDRHGEMQYVLSRGRPIRDANGRITSWAGVSLDVTAQRRTEQARQLLMRELNHRVKNLFAVASGMVTMTARTTRTTAEMAEALNGRLIALAKAHELIRPAVTAELPGDDKTTLPVLVRAVISPHLQGTDDQLVLSGAPVEIGPNAATSLALVFHELATNAAKYGALSDAAGTLSISWFVAGGRLDLEWSEGGGPLIARAPVHEGFGSKLARMSASGQLGGEIRYDWRPQGVRIALSAMLDHLRR